MPSPTVIVNHKTYRGVGRLSIPLSTGTGNGDFIYIGGDPGSLPQWQASVKIAGVKYNAVQRVTLPKQGGGEAHYLCAAGTFREFPVNPVGVKVHFVLQSRVHLGREGHGPGLRVIHRLSIRY